LKEFKDTGTTFFIEMGLDAGHFMGLKEAGSGLGLADRSSVRPLLAAEMTGRDVLALLRARLNYGIELDRMRPFLAVLDDLQAERLAQAESVEKARPVLALLLGAKVAERAATIPQLEVAVWSEIRRMAAAKFRFSLDDLASPASYYYLKRIELANLISVIEGVRLGLSREEIRGSLLPRAGASGCLLRRR
jgi:vacuolar-type H+-ATPase subunit C/Vma6